MTQLEPEMCGASCDRPAADDSTGAYITGKKSSEVPACIPKAFWLQVEAYANMHRGQGWINPTNFCGSKTIHE
jgi:hypothetical protein